MPILAPGSTLDWQLSSGSLQLGPGTPYGLNGLVGWLDLTDVRSLDQAKTVGDGAWNGPDYLDGRLVDVTVDVTATSSTSFADAVQKLMDGTQRSNTPAQWTLTLPGRTPETILAKVRRRKIPTEIEYQFGLTTASFQLYSNDWRRFGADLTASTGLPQTTGGLTVPFTVPMSINSTVASGTCSLTNPGNATGPVRLRISGPVTGPIVTHVGSGVQLVFSSSLSLGSGEYIDVDMEAKTVLAQGDTGRANFVTSRGWSGFDPGVNVWAFSAASFSSGASLAVTATPASI